MATSGSYNFALTRNNLITRAFQLINVYGFSATVQTNDLNYAADLLNSLIKQWQAEGIKLWKRRTAFLFPALNDYNYSIGLSGDHCTNTYVKTTISANEASSQTVLSLTSTTGMTAADNIGIELDNGTRFWTTIVSVDSAVQVTITTGITGAAASGNTVVTYTSKINRPLRIIQANSLDFDSNNSETTMQPISHDEFFSYPSKSTGGKPCVFYYDKQLSSGVLNLFPRPNNVNQIVTFVYHDGLQDMDSSSDDFDFPQEWTLALIYNLAVLLATSYGKFTELQVIVPLAKEYKDSVANFDSDEEDLNISFDPGF